MGLPEAQKFCFDDHGQGLVIWDSGEKFKDVLFVAGKSGTDKGAVTALTNPNSVNCYLLSLPCSNQLVNNLWNVNQNVDVITYNRFSLQKWQPIYNASYIPYIDEGFFE